MSINCSECKPLGYLNEVCLYCVWLGSECQIEGKVYNKARTNPDILNTPTLFNSSFNNKSHMHTYHRFIYHKSASKLQQCAVILST